jgi:hypothetical protein
MTTVTWNDLFGFDYGPGMPQPVRLSAKKLPRQAPVVTALLALLKTASSQGAPAPATAAQAWGRGALTPHNVGAAVDIFYGADADGSRAFANGLVELFIRHRVALGWGYISYNHMHFDPHRLNAADGDNEHQDHVHIDWVDYGPSRRSTALRTFDYIDEAGAPKTKNVDSGGQWVSMDWRSGADQATLPAAFVIDFNAHCRQAAMNQRRQAAFTASELGAAYHGVAVDASLSWLQGWWDVSDGNQYYYYFGPKGFVQYTKSKPASTAKPLAVAMNQGVYSVTDDNTLYIDWNPADGGTTVETFPGARTGSGRLAGTSNRYAPLVATRMA